MIAVPPQAARVSTSGRDRVDAPRHDGRSGAGRAAGLAVVAVTAAVDPAGLAPFGPARWAVATTATLALGAVVLGRRPLRPARVPTALFVAFVAWTAVAAAGGVDPLYAWTGTPERHAGVLAWGLCGVAFLAGQALRDHERRHVAPFVAVAAAVAGGWAVAELLGWQPVAVTGTSGRPGGPFGSSAYLGAAAALLAPPAWALAFDRSRPTAVRLLASAGGSLGTVALVAAGARAAWAGAALAVVVALALRRGGGGRRWAAAGAVAGVVVLAALVTGAAGRLPDLVRDEQGGAQGRLDEWRIAARVVAGHPVAGVGPEGYRIAFADAVDERYETRHGRDPLPDRAHTALLDVAATTGVPGAALYAALLGVLVALLLRALRTTDRWTAGAACGVLAYFAQSLVLFPIPELDVLAWLLAGVVVGRVAHDREQARPRRLPPAATPAFVAGAVVLAGLGVLDIAADRAAAYTLATATAGPTTATPSYDVGRAARLRPDALRYHLVAARAREARGTLAGIDAALGHVRDARRVSPRDPIVHRELARLLLERARRSNAAPDVDAARRQLERMARDDPFNAATLLQLGLARALDGDHGGAERAWLAAERLAPHSAAASTNLAIAYAQAGRADDARRAAHRALERNPEEERARHVLRLLDEKHGT